jgi:hypothetical protein
MHPHHLSPSQCVTILKTVPLMDKSSSGDPSSQPKSWFSWRTSLQIVPGCHRATSGTQQRGVADRGGDDAASKLRPQQKLQKRRAPVLGDSDGARAVRAGRLPRSPLPAVSARPPTWLVGVGCAGFATMARGSIVGRLSPARRDASGRKDAIFRLLTIIRSTLLSVSVAGQARRERQRQ